MPAIANTTNNCSFLKTNWISQAHSVIYTSPRFHMLFFKQDCSIWLNEELKVHPSIYCRCQQSCVLPCGLSGCCSDALSQMRSWQPGRFLRPSSAVSHLDICGCTLYVCSVYNIRAEMICCATIMQNYQSYTRWKLHMSCCGDFCPSVCDDSLCL